MTDQISPVAKNEPEAIMRALGVAALGVAVMCAASASPRAQGDLFTSLEENTCHGAMVLTRGAGGDAKTISVPVAMAWFRRPDGSTWVNFTYASRPPAARPVHIKPEGLVFYGSYGQPYSLQGDSRHLAGATFTDSATGTVQVDCAPAPASARVIPSPPVAPVQQFDVASKLNGRTYRLMVRVPAEPPPAHGYPVLYILDGNYYFGTLSDEAERMVAQRIVRPFLVVAVGYPTDDRAEQGVFRDFDLSLPAPGRPPARYGGVDVFLQVLDQELRPFVAGHFPVAAGEQALYGHSFGGLTALRELFRNPGSFSAYVLSSPSIGWADKAVLADEAAFSQQAREGKVHAKVLITSAGDEQSAANLPGGDPEAARARMVDNASELASRLAVLNPQLMPVSRVIFAGEIHGSVPQASSSRAVRFAIAPP